MNSSAAFNILVTGVGGQGVLWISKVIAAAACHTYPFVCRTESRGLSQRGGTVTSEVRFGIRPMTPVVATGSEDLILAMDGIEGLRVIECLRSGGHLLTNSQFSVPSYLRAKWRSDQTEEASECLLKGELISLWNDHRVVAIDLNHLAARAGISKALDVLLVGAASAFIPLPNGVLFDSVLAHCSSRSNEEYALGFELGREACLNNSTGTLVHVIAHKY